MRLQGVEAQRCACGAFQEAVYGREAGVVHRESRGLEEVGHVAELEVGVEARVLAAAPGQGSGHCVAVGEEYVDVVDDGRGADGEFLFLEGEVGAALFLDLRFHVDLRLHGAHGVEEESEYAQAAHHLYGGHGLCPAVGRRVVAESECGDGDNAVV